MNIPFFGPSPSIGAGAAGCRRGLRAESTLALERHLRGIAFLHPEFGKVLRSAISHINGMVSVRRRRREISASMEIEAKRAHDASVARSGCACSTTRPHLRAAIEAAFDEGEGDFPETKAQISGAAVQALQRLADAGYVLSGFLLTHSSEGIHCAMNGDGRIRWIDQRTSVALKSVEDPHNEGLPKIAIFSIDRD